MKIQIIEHHVTENMLGILSARVLREEPKKLAKTVSLYGTSVSWPHWYAHLLLVVGSCKDWRFHNSLLC